MTFKVLFRLRFVAVFVLLLSTASVARAATTPSLNAADTYAILSNKYTNTVIGSTITGDIGFTTGPALAPGGVQMNYGAGAPYATAGIDQGNALTALSVQPCTFTFAPGAIDLSTDITHGPVSVYTPGVYCSTGAMTISGPLTLNGSGTYIFRAVGALSTAAGAVVTLAGASACDVFWTPTAATTLAANTSFEGTVIANAGITVGANTTWNGRALAFGGTVTTDTDTITAPLCIVVPVPGFSSNSPSPLINVRKVPSPLSLPNGPGLVTYGYTVTNPGVLTMHTITLVDDKCADVKYVSGDTNANALLETSETWIYTCATTLNKTTVNFATARGLANDIAAVDTAIAEVFVGVAIDPPLIHVVKTPSPLNLPFNGGPVTYSYNVSNPGTVALSNVSLTDNKCSAVNFVSGDTNGDMKLQMNETWRYTCLTTIKNTTTNTAIARGEANVFIAIDTAIATVIVAGSPVPPLIHVIKKPEPVLLPPEGGMVTYTYTVTNPGTVALSEVTLNDDKCHNVTLVSGDTNNDHLMQPLESWTYTCQQIISGTTTNTATASGQANDLIATDVAVASVVVPPAIIAPAPRLPNTGADSVMSFLNLIVAAVSAFAIALVSLAFIQWKRQSR